MINNLKCFFFKYFRKMIAVKRKYEKKKQCLKIVEFLSKMSGYSQLLIHYRMSSKPQFKYPSFQESKNVANIIIKEGYEWNDIVWSIQVLAVSQKLIIDRFAQLKKINYQPKFLNFLLMRNKSFDDYVNTCKNK